MTSGAVPERHRELVPHRRPDWQRPFRDGRAKPFHDGHAATQGGTGRADRCQCVGARGKNSNADPAGQASFAAENGARDRGGTTDHPRVIRLSVLKAWAVGPPQDREQPLKVTVPGHANLAVASGATKGQGRHVVKATRHVSIEGLHGCKASEYSAHEAQR